MKHFKNYKNEIVILHHDTEIHIEEVHPEITISDIKSTLATPDEVRQSSYKDNCELYYLKKVDKRFTCVIVKICKDGNFISTALTTVKPKHGKILYKKKGD